MSWHDETSTLVCWSNISIWTLLELNHRPRKVSRDINKSETHENNVTVIIKYLAKHLKVINFLYYVLPLVYIARHERYCDIGLGITASWFWSHQLAVLLVTLIFLRQLRNKNLQVRQCLRGKNLLKKKIKYRNTSWGFNS